METHFFVLVTLLTLSPFVVGRKIWPVWSQVPASGCFEGECETYTVTCEYGGSEEVQSIKISKRSSTNPAQMIELTKITEDNPSQPVDTGDIGTAVSQGDLGITRDNAWLSLTWDHPVREIGGKHLCYVVVKLEGGRTKEGIASLIIMVPKRSNTSPPQQTQQDQKLEQLARAEQKLEQLARAEQKLEDKIETLEKEMDDLVDSPRFKSLLEKMTSDGVQMAENLVTKSEPIRRDNHTYVLSEVIMAGNRLSGRICRSMKGYLAEIDDEEEFLFITKFLNHYMAPTQVALIGGTDKGRKGEWVFQRTNEKVKFFDWLPGQPSGGDGEDCLSLVKDDVTMGVKMNDWPCDWLTETKAFDYAFLCEIPPE